jgi:hypothetical protein
MGAAQPRWRRDGKELFYISGDGKLMAVEIKTNNGFAAGIPKPLFQTRIASGELAGAEVPTTTRSSDQVLFCRDIKRARHARFGPSGQALERGNLSTAIAEMSLFA